MAVFRVEKNKDYTVMSNHHLRNKNLSLRGKGLLSLMLSLPENWDYSTEGLAHICKEGVDAICSIVSELEEQGYITRSRSRDGKGRLGAMEYVIHEQPTNDKTVNKKTKKPKRDNPVLDNPVLDEPVLGNPILDQPGLVNPAQLNIDTLNINQSKKEKENTDLLNIHQSITNQSTPTNKTPKTNSSKNTPASDGVDMMDLIETYRKIVQKNIEYGCLMQRFDPVRVNEYVNIMLDAICRQGGTVSVNSIELPVEVVRDRLLKLDFSHIEYVLECMAKNTTKVYSIKNYILTALYNSYTTIDSYYQSTVTHDLYGDGNLFGIKK